MRCRGVQGRGSGAVPAHRFRVGRVAILSPGGSDVGVSHTELMTAFTPLLKNLCGEVGVVAASDSPVLDLIGLQAGRQSVERLGSLPAVSEWATSQTQPVSVVSYLSLWSPRVSAEKMSALRAAVPLESRFFFVDPTASVGLAYRAQRLSKVVFVRRLGLSFHRDIPEFVRASGWEPTSVFRFSVGYPASLLTFVAGEARAY